MDFSQEDGFSAEMGFQVYKGKILKINGDKDKLYALIQFQQSIKLKMYNLVNGIFEEKASIREIQDKFPLFIKVFKNSLHMQSNCFILSKSSIA